MNSARRNIHKEVRRLDNERVEEQRRVRNAMQEDAIFDSNRRLLIRSESGEFWSIGVTDDGVVTASSIGRSL